MVLALIVALGATVGSVLALRSPVRAQPAPAPERPEVGIIVVHRAVTPLPLEYAGRVAGFRDVEVRARVDGLLLTRDFEEGGEVEKGQALFEIDPAPFRLALSRAQADLLRAQATLRQAEEEFGRTEDLFQRGVSAQKQRGVALAARDQARANVQLAQADVDSATLNLGYTTLTAPVAGVTAFRSPPVGTLVQAQQTVLTTITQIDPAYVNFSVSDEEDQDLEALNARRTSPLKRADLAVSIRFGSGRNYPLPGKLDLAARRVDTQTGTIQTRAVFPNPDQVLLPGQFVRVHIDGVTIPDAITVPSRAVSQGQQGATVYVVGKNDDAELRVIRLGAEVGTGWVVEDGLKEGDRVIVDGVIRVSPGTVVKPVPIAAAR
jgi:membrane fusion protein (multidrug efflux system)